MKPAPKPNDALAAAFLVLAAAVPLAWTPAAVAEYTLPKLAALNLGLLLAAWGAVVRPAALAGGLTALDAPLAALLAVAAASALRSADPSTSLLGRYDSYVHGLWGMAMIAAAAQLGARGARGREDSVLRLLSRTAAAVGGYAVIQRLGWDPVLSLDKLPTGLRAVSTLGSPVDLGAYLALLVPAALLRAEKEPGAEPKAAAALVLAGLAACGSRGAMAAAALGAAAYVLLSRREPRRALPFAAAAAVAVAAAAMAWSSRHGASVSDQGRREVWITAWRMFLARPWLGCGPDGFADAFKIARTDAFVALMGGIHYQAYAHNAVLHVLSSLGLAGAAACAWLLLGLGRAARSVLEDPRARALAAALAAGLLALWVNLELNPASLEVWTAGALVAGLLVSLAPRPEPRPFPGPALAAAALLATASFLFASYSLRADLVYKRGLRAHVAGKFEEARSLIAAARRQMPCEPSYAMGEFNGITDWINADKTVAGRLALLARADEIAKESVACHPNLSVPHYIAAGAARIHYDLGFNDRLGDALREYDAALAFDPKFGPLLDAREAARRLQSHRR